MAEALRAGEPRADGSYRFELYTTSPKGKLAAARVKALIAVLADALHVNSDRIKLWPLPVERGAAFAAFVPPAKGARIRNE
jgi:hypothetical protein